MASTKIKKIHEEWCIKNGYKHTSSQALKRRVGPQAIKRASYTRKTQRGSWRAPKLN